MNSKHTKKALLSSVVALVLCFAMMLGTTFAWFTDTASTGVNKIQAGTLKIDIVDKDGESLDGESLDFVKADAASQEDILWEPGVTYLTEGFQIKNIGNLALKFTLSINGISGDDKLLEVIEFTVVKATTQDNTTTYTEVTETGGYMGTIDAGATYSETYYIRGHMKESADNDYQGLTLTGLGVTVYATQWTKEYDSFNNQYDAGAKIAVVSSEEDLRSAITGGAAMIVLQSDIELTNGTNTGNALGALQITGSTVIDLNGYTIKPASGYQVQNIDDGAAQDYLIAVKRGGSLTINDSVGTGGIDTGDYAALNAAIKLTIKGEAATGVPAKLTINGGTFAGYWFAICGNGARNDTELVINDGTFKANKNDGGTYGIYQAQKGTIVINGGTFTGDNAAIEMRGGDLTINGGTFTATAVSDSTTSNGSGTTTVGAALALAPHRNGGEVYTINAAINGGAFEAYKAVNVFYDSYCNGDEVSLTITGGKFSTDITNFVATGYSVIKVGSVYQVGTPVGGTVNSALSTGSGTYKLTENVTTGTNAAYGSNGVGIKMAAGTTLDGDNKTLSKGDASGYAILTAGSTIKNVTITDSARAIFIDKPTADTVIENVTISGAGYPINTGSKGSDTAKLIVSNSTINGWTSFASIASASFTNCIFGKSTYYSQDVYQHYIRPYVTSTFTNCDFDNGLHFDLSKLPAGATITFTNCTCEGTALTADNVYNYLHLYLDANDTEPTSASDFAGILIFG